MTNLLLFGATILVIMHIAGSVLDTNEPGDFTARIVFPSTNVDTVRCDEGGNPSTAGSNCIAVASSQFFAPRAETYIVAGMQVRDDTKYRMISVSPNRVGVQMGVDPGYFLIEVTPVIAQTISSNDPHLVETGIVQAAQIPILVGASQSNQGAFSWILNGIDAIKDALSLVMRYLIFDYAMLQSSAAPVVFARYIITTFQSAFIVIMIIYGVRLIRGAG